MLFKSRSSCNRAVFFALVFLSMQVYVLYMSTFHVFHGMPPMCELCAAVKNYQNGIASSPNIALANYSFEEILQSVPQHHYLIVNPLYQPRAPPSSNGII